MSSNSEKYTFLGFLTIIIWGTSALFTRNLSVGIGAYTSASLVNILGGVIVVVGQMIKKEGLADIKYVSKKYWLVCGTLFILYTASSYVSMNMVESDESVVILVLIRFLWPLFTLLFTIPILKAKASLWVIGGVSISMLGIIVAKLGSVEFQLSELISKIFDGGELGGYLMGLVSAISWGLYTNWTKKYIGIAKVDGVGIYMILTSVVLGGVAFFMEEPRNFSKDFIYQILYAGVVVGALANFWWNLAIKKGNMLLVVLVSNFLPIISTIMTALMLGVGITTGIVIGSLLVVIGTIWSKRCFKEF